MSFLKFCRLSQVIKPQDRIINNLQKFCTSRYTMDWKLEKKKFMDLKTPEAQSGSIHISRIPTWKSILEKKEPVYTKIPILSSKYSIQDVMNAQLAEKVSYIQGDITQLQVDAIVNAANKTLLGGGGVDGAIHKCAGTFLVEECRSLNGCNVGEAKITGAYRLPAKYVIHTVGPQGEKPDLLEKCYSNCLKIMHEENLRTIAFPCISTGIYGYPQDAAVHVALGTVRSFLESHPTSIDRVIFCLFTELDLVLYQGALQSYFPLQ